jgi:hypothetical protein
VEVVGVVVAVVEVSGSDDDVDDGDAVVGRAGEDVEVVEDPGTAARTRRVVDTPTFPPPHRRPSW